MRNLQIGLPARDEIPSFFIFERPEIAFEIGIKKPKKAEFLVLQNMRYFVCQQNFWNAQIAPPVAPCQIWFDENASSKR